MKRSPILNALYGNAGGPIKRFLFRGTTHDEVYGDDYFTMVDQTTGDSAEVIASTIIDHFCPQSVIDIGCGPGNLIDHLRSCGVTVKGVEHAKSALHYCHQRRLDVAEIDLSDPKQNSATLGAFDLAVSMEVGHQLPPTSAVEYVSFICRHADVILFTSPSRGDDRLPLNPQPPRYWIGKFEAQGFHFDEPLSSEFRTKWKHKQIASWFYEFPMIYRKRS